MSRPPFTEAPGAWIYSRRDAQTPAEYAACLERPAPHDQRFARVAIVGVVVLLLVVLVPVVINQFAK